MKQVILVICCFFLINSSECFSQSFEKTKKEIKTKTKYVYGRSTDFTDYLYLGISFGKDIRLSDTTYYVKLRLSAPSSEYRTDICFNKASSILFLTKSGKNIDLKMSDVYSLTESDKLTTYPYAIEDEYIYTTTLILNLTKEKLIEIGSEPFYRITLPYYNITSKIDNKVVFIKPTILTPRIFIQKDVKYILDN